MKTILLIDNGPESSGLADVLKGFGYEVIASRDGLSALSLIREGAPIDLVITDYPLTGMDGLEFLASLRKLAPAVPSVMLTAYGSVETYLKAYSLGVFEYVNKPVTTKELGRIVKTALNGARAFEKTNRATQNVL
jgi:DNA-binding NtrC family response regulator